ncbi:F-box protein At5g07610-like isoform X2 [Panicum virgatum]|uniref:F-box protein At5g07610-like isoform X2 n=1 Tax=Panicum virgatum TaxID=38727 RepID=UPI0019D5373A|nr:F-box protein At5g07610-like isoform X2 [Panicum virgatum]
MESPPEKRNPASSLADELLVEILRRVPVRSLCRFKCVSRSWRNLISDPDYRKKLPQTLVGFFYQSLSGKRYPCSANHFTNVTGKGIPFIYPSFSFLPVPSDDLVLLDSCNGLLLCRCFEPDPHKGDEIPPFHYAVCNPATQKWVMLPDGSWASGEARTALLGFDPAVSSHFYVVEYVLDEGECVIGVEIYSSKTAAWSFKESEWGDDVMLYRKARSVFLNVFMHMLTFSDGIVLADMEGKTWRTIPVPTDGWSGGCIHQAQGRLCFINVDDTNEWTLKHSVRTLLLFGWKNLQFEWRYTVITVHPECNLIYFVYGWNRTLMAYEMDRKEVRVIRDLGHDCLEPYLAYVPLFSEALADEQ